MGTKCSCVSHPCSDAGETQTQEVIAMQPLGDVQGQQVDAVIMAGISGEKGKIHAYAPVRELSSNTDDLHKLCFVDLEDLRSQNSMPRCGDDIAFKHPLSGEPNHNIGREASTFDRQTTCFVFVSQRWLRPGTGTEGHPDNADADKLKLMVAAIDALKGTIIPATFTVALWMDFMCVNQDNRPYNSFLQLMDSAISASDVMLTPIVDINHMAWSPPKQWSDPFEEYRAEEWLKYWSRAWCRLESLLAAVLPHQDDHVDRAKRFPPGALHSALTAGHRAHMIFGTKQFESEIAPLFLPPLHTHLTKYPPLEGRYSNSRDDDVLRKINQHAMELARNKQLKDIYHGETDSDGKPHGKGRQVWSSGKVQEGHFCHGKLHGKGKCMYPFWDFYEGDWSNGKRDGFGLHLYANGEKYEGTWAANKKHGTGTLTLTSGVVQEGEFYEGVFVGQSDEAPRI